MLLSSLGSDVLIQVARTTRSPTGIQGIRNTHGVRDLPVRVIARRLQPGPLISRTALEIGHRWCARKAARSIRVCVASCCFSRSVKVQLLALNRSTVFITAWKSRPLRLSVRAVLAGRFARNGRPLMLGPYVPQVLSNTWHQAAEVRNCLHWRRGVAAEPSAADRWASRLVGTINTIVFL